VNEFVPNYAIPPGETLKETLWYQEMSLTELKEETGYSKEILAGVIAGRVPIDHEMARRFESAFGIPASLWLNLERNYQQDLKRIKEKMKNGNEHRR